MSTYGEDMARGCLETGESLEAAYGPGPWSPDPWESAEMELPQIVQCYKCGGNAYDLIDELECENCGRIPAPKVEDQ